jgi:hypothetical protein
VISSRIARIDLDPARRDHEARARCSRKRSLVVASLVARAQLHSRDLVVLQLAQGTLALRTHTRASTTFALSPPKLLGAEGRGLTPVACRAQAP